MDSSSRFLSMYKKKDSNKNRGARSRAAQDTVILPFYPDTPLLPHSAVDFASSSSAIDFFLSFSSSGSSSFPSCYFRASSSSLICSVASCLLSSSSSIYAASHSSLPHEVSETLRLDMSPSLLSLTFSLQSLAMSLVALLPLTLLSSHPFFSQSHHRFFLLSVAQGWVMTSCPKCGVFFHLLCLADSCAVAAPVEGHHAVVHASASTDHEDEHDEDDASCLIIDSDHDDADHSSSDFASLPALSSFHDSVASSSSLSSTATKTMSSLPRIILLLHGFIIQDYLVASSVLFLLHIFLLCLRFSLGLHFEMIIEP